VRRSRIPFVGWALEGLGTPPKLHSFDFQSGFPVTLACSGFTPGANPHLDHQPYKQWCDTSVIKKNGRCITPLGKQGRQTHKYERGHAAEKRRTFRARKEYTKAELKQHPIHKNRFRAAFSYNFFHITVRCTRMASLHSSKLRKKP